MQMNKTMIIMAMGLTVAAGAAFAGEGKGMRGENRPSFAEMDADSNGEVTLAEIEAIHALRFTTADTNGDGELSAEELVAARGGDKPERAMKKAERMIEKMDTDESGSLSAEEMAAKGRNHTEMFEKLDADNSGGISEEEFAAAHKGRSGKGYDDKASN